jgi:uncharacterized membrane protein required for colicin V production
MVDWETGERATPVQFKKPRKRSDKKSIPPLLIGALGTVGAVALYLLVPGLQFIELVLLLVVVGFGAVGYMRGIVRGAMTIVLLYVATGIAATLYPIPAPYVAATGQFFALIFTGHALSGELDVSNQNVGGGSLALSFALLTVVIWVALEAIGRVASRDTSLPRLGILDNLGGVVVHLVIGTLVASLLFNAIGYGPSWRVHDKALLRRRFNQVLAIHYNAQSFWFPRTPPPIYVYDLDVPRER